MAASSAKCFRRTRSSSGAKTKWIGRINAAQKAPAMIHHDPNTTPRSPAMKRSSPARVAGNVEQLSRVLNRQRDRVERRTDEEQDCCGREYERDRRVDEPATRAERLAALALLFDPGTAGEHRRDQQQKAEHHEQRDRGEDEAEGNVGEARIVGPGSSSVESAAPHRPLFLTEPLLGRPQTIEDADHLRLADRRLRILERDLDVFAHALLHLLHDFGTRSAQLAAEALKVVVELLACCRCHFDHRFPCFRRPPMARWRLSQC